MSLLVSSVCSANSGQVGGIMPSRIEISVWLKKLLLKNLDPAVQIISPLFAISILYFEHAQIIKHPGDRRQVKIHSNLEY